MPFQADDRFLSYTSFLVYVFLPCTHKLPNSQNSPLIPLHASIPSSYLQCHNPLFFTNGYSTGFSHL